MPDRQPGLFDILLIEDSEAEIRLVQLALEEATVHCRLHVAWSGDAALRMLRGEGEYDGALRPDLILLALHPTGKDGCGIVQEIRGDDVLRDIPVILLTGTRDDAIDGAPSAFGARQMRKPCDRASFNRLVAEIEEICARIVS